jgi:hypothetical protein
MMTAGGESGEMPRAIGGRRRAAWLLSVLVLLMLAGCGGKPRQPASLTDSCQFAACVCSDADGSLFRQSRWVPIQWSAAGEPTCPEGFALRVTREPKPVR